MAIRRKKSHTGAVTVPDYNGRPMEPFITDNPAWVSNLQRRMHDYCMTDGVARFSTSFVADAGARVDLVVERYVPGVGWSQDFTMEKTKPWAKQADTLNMLLSQFRGKYTEQSRTIWNLLWNKRAAGEVFVSQETDPQIGTMTWTPYSFVSCKPKAGPRGEPGYELFDRPSTPRWVPASQVVRMWTAHPDYPLMPYSPLWAGLKDLDRFSLMGKVMDRAANSALLQRGLVWFPGEAMDETITIDGKEQPKLARDYYQSAQQTMNATDDSSSPAVVPFLVWWDSDLGAPERIEFKMPFNDEWMNARNAAITDFARAVDLPSVVVINGGAGGGGSEGSSNNHWSDLLVDRRTFDMTIGGELDGLCHEDLTRHFLKPQMIHYADREDFPVRDEIRWWRVGFDPTRLIVNQDRSLTATDDWRMGLINMEAAIKRKGYRLDEMAGADDWKILADLVTREAQSLGVTRHRTRQLNSDMGGGGTDVNLEHASAAAATLVESGNELVWLDA